VVISLRQNTEALQSINDNFIYDVQDEWLADASDNAELTGIVAKANAGESMNDVERLRYYYWVMRQLNLWEVAFIRNSEGVMPPSQWAASDKSFRYLVPSRMPEDTCNRENFGFGDGFRNHVDAAYAERRNKP